MTGFLLIAVRPGKKPTEEDNAAFLRLLKENGISESNVVDVSQEGKFAVCSEEHQWPAVK